MAINSPVLVLLTIITLLTKCRQDNSNVKCMYESLERCEIKEPRYDTISGIFLYENYISAYMDIDAIVKPGGFIKEKYDLEKSYKRGYYLISPYYVSVFSKRNPSSLYDTTSIKRFSEEQYYNSVQSGQFYEKTGINPYCGAYYRRYYLDIVVLEIGFVYQRMPLFLSCKEQENYVDKNQGRNYQNAAIPTYLIINIIEGRELQSHSREAEQ